MRERFRFIERRRCGPHPRRRCARARRKFLRRDVVVVGCEGGLSRCDGRRRDAVSPGTRERKDLHGRESRSGHHSRLASPARLGRGVGRARLSDRPVETDIEERYERGAVRAVLHRVAKERRRSMAGVDRSRHRTLGCDGWGAPLEKIAADARPAPIETVRAAEARFSVASEGHGSAAAYRAFGSRYLRILRDDEAPIDAIVALDSATRSSSPLSSTSGAERWTWTATDSGTARSSDLAWTMGRYGADDARGVTKAGYYVRVWRAEGSAWKILGDVLAPIEEPAR